ncbi:MAG: heme-degrading domain-containing protein [Janthinobacterium lividum]
MLLLMYETDIAVIRRQEDELQLPRFSKQVVWEIGLLARNLAGERGHAIGIEIVATGVPVFTTAFDGTSVGTMRWLRRKAATVAHFDRSSYGIWLQLQSKGQTLAVRHALPDAEFAADGGGFPLRVVSAGLVGSLTISGLDQRSDHEFAVEVLCRYLGQDYASLAQPAQPAQG